ncbi:MAG: hypothetical protein Tsb0021_14930 [Chlamydiales bacterium]
MNFLDDKEREILKIQHKKELDGRIRDRIKAVLLNDRGWTPQQIAEALIIQNTMFRKKIIGHYAADLVVTPDCFYSHPAAFY